MKSIIALLAAAVLLASCTNQVPPLKSAPAPEIAGNIQINSGHLTANFENQEAAAIYFTGGASVLLPAKGQFEMAGNFTVDRTGWYCIDPETGDYFYLRRNGFASGKVKGMTFNLMPEQPIQ